jgi:PAS domain S-box-containing protein
MSFSHSSTENTAMTIHYDDSLPHRADILIVDDNPENLKVLGDFFSDQGFNVRIARDGRQALANASASPPEIILLDIHMPVMDGYETCTRLKASASLRDCPVVFLSALGETFNKVRAFECGGADYITKPFNLDEVRVRVNNHLQASRLLAESRAGYRASFEQAAVGMAHLGMDGQFQAVNQCLCTTFGYTAAEFTARTLQDLVEPGTLLDINGALEAVRAGQMVPPVNDILCYTGARDAIWCRFTFSLVTMPSTGKQYIGTIIENVSEYHESVEERRRLAAALEQSLEAYAITDAAGITQYVNSAYESTFCIARKDAIGSPLPLLDREADSAVASPIWQALAEGGIWRDRITRTAGDGKPCIEEHTISPIRNAAGAVVNYVCVTRDLTRQVRLEEQVRQSQKMEAIGTLAAGIAHDFNNLLAAIMGFTDLTMTELPEGHPAQSDLRQVLTAANHAAELVRHILAFGRKSTFEIRPLRLQAIAEEALKLLRRSIPPTIEIHCNADPHCRPILADTTAINQIFMNLCTNAYHAMEQTGGTLSIRISEVTLGEEPKQIGMDLNPGTYARLDVSDTGHGMETAVAQRIFEPYFTTKERGHGTGLGLATVHGIVTDLKGAIHVYSEPGNGSTFSVFLPIALEEAVSADPASSNPLGEPGTECILFIDDEPAICLLAERSLARLGYTAVTFTNPLLALDRFREQPGAFDVVVTDEMMPGLRGTQLLGELRAIRADIPVILYSGFAETLRNKASHPAAFSAYAMKPMVIPELTQAIRKVLRK